MIWIVHFVTITTLFIFSKIRDKDNIFIYGSFLFVMFVYGQRWLSGTDFPGYLRYYISGFTRIEEFLYFGLQELLAHFNIYFGVFLAIILFIIIFNFYKFILKLEKSSEIMLLIFLFSEMFFAQLSQIRQFVAISFFIHAFYYAYHNQNKKGIFNIIIAGLFHKTAYFMLLFVFFKPKQNKTTSIYSMIFSLFLPILDIKFIFSLPIFSNYSSYVDSIFSTSLSPFHYVRYYLVLIIVLFILWNIDRISTEANDQMIINGLIFYFILYGLSFQFGILMRVSLYFKIFEIVAIIYFADRVINLSKHMIHLLTVGAFLGIFSGLVLTDPYDISLYEFEPIRIFDTRGYDYHNNEISRFYRKQENS